MKRFAALFASALALFVCAEIAHALTTPANVGPVTTNPMPNYDQYLETTRVIDLSQFFADPDGTAAARLTTVLGPITVTLDGSHAPATVANFLNYINTGRYFGIDPTNGDRTMTFIHRAAVSNGVPFVIQGGGFLSTVNAVNPQVATPTQVLTYPAVMNEPFLSNIRGTIAMAKQAGNPNSATSQWFINMGDNRGTSPNGLDFQNGSFTVFGHVTGNGMSVADAIAALPKFNGGSPFDELPVRSYVSPNPVKNENLVLVPEFIPASPLAYTATSSNPSVATAVTSEGNLLVNAFALGTTQITVTGFDLDGAGPVSQSFTVNVITAPGRVRNISTRAEFPTGQETLTAGFIVRGGTTKRLVIRAIGPSSGAGTHVDDPSLELLAADGSLIASNNDWGTALNKQELIDLQIQPGSEKESAILVEVPSTDADITSYTARMRSANGHPGIGLIEVYDIDSQPGSTLRNISTVGPVGTGINVLVGGFIVRGSDSRRLIIRALGPSLADRGLSGVLANPTIEVHDNQGTLVAFNDDWQAGADAGEIQTIGLQPTNPSEAAVIATLGTGEYTATVAGTGDAPTGLGQIEVFQVQ